MGHPANPHGWDCWWGQGWQYGGGACLEEMSAVTQDTHVLPSCQVKIFEEDFQRERSDRERMNEEKEELKQQLEKLQKQLVLSNNQVSSARCLWEPHVLPGCVRDARAMSQLLYPPQSRGWNGDRKAREMILLLLVPAGASAFNSPLPSAPVLGT